MSRSSKRGRRIPGGQQVGGRDRPIRSVGYYLAESERMALALKGTAGHPSDREALSWFQTELGNLIHTITELRDSGSWLAVSALWKNLVPFCVRVGAWNCLEQVSEDALVAAERLGDRVQHLEALHALGIAKQHLDDEDQAESIFEQVVQQASPDEPLRRAEALSQWAQIKKGQGQVLEANRMLHQAAVSYRAGGDRIGQARVLGDLANLLDDRGAEEKALETYEEALEIFHASDAPLDEAIVLSNIGLVHLGRGRANASLAPLERAAVIYRALQSDVNEARTLRLMASAHLELGHASQAEDLLRRALEIFEREGDAEAERTKTLLWWAGTIVAVDILLAAASDQERRRAVEQHPELLEDRTDEVLAQRLHEARAENQAELSIIEDARRLLGTLRQEQAEVVFEGLWADLQGLASADSPLPTELKGFIWSMASTRDPAHGIDMLNQALATVSQDRHPVLWATLAIWLGQSYLNPPFASEPGNLEAAIEHLTGALDARDWSNDSETWAAVQLWLGSAYRNRSRSHRGESVEHAISHIRRALTVYRRTTHAVEWAWAVHNLANAYADRTVDNRSKNLERAIKRLHTAVVVFTEEDARDQAALANANLGLRYIERIEGNRAENIEAAIKYLHRALADQSETAPAAQVTVVLMNLGHAYLERIHGDRAENVEDAIKHLSRCFDLSQRAGLTRSAADTALTLGNAYSHRRNGDRADNVEEAIGWYQRAQALCSREHIPIDWAMATDSLGSAYHARVHGPLIDNLQQSIALREEALAAIERDDAPRVWARILHNLAATLIEFEADWATERAVALLEQALEVRQPESIPLDWAESVVCLADAYALRTAGDRTENLERAATLRRRALTVYDPEILPAEATRTSAGLGDILSELGAWGEAAAAYEVALDTAERRYQASALQPSRQAELVAAGDLSQRAAYAMSRSGNAVAAVVTLERGRARELGDITERDRADLTEVEHTDPNAAAAYHRAAARVRSLEAAGRAVAAYGSDQTEGRAEADVVRAEAQDAEAELQAVVEGIRSHPGAGGFLARPGFPELTRVVRADMALVYLVTRPQGSLALIVHLDPNTDVAVEPLWLDSFDEPRLDALLIQENDQHEVIGGYLADQFSDQTDHGRFDASLAESLDFLGVHLMGPLADRLRRLGIKRLALVPGGRLGLLPLHAARIGHDAGSNFLSDEFEVSYAPSARVLAASMDSFRKQQGSPPVLAGVGNPSKDLVSCAGDSLLKCDRVGGWRGQDDPKRR